MFFHGLYNIFYIGMKWESETLLLVFLTQLPLERPSSMIKCPRLYFVLFKLILFSLRSPLFRYLNTLFIIRVQRIVIYLNL